MLEKNMSEKTARALPRKFFHLVLKLIRWPEISAWFRSKRESSAKFVEPFWENFLFFRKLQSEFGWPKRIKSLVANEESERLSARLRVLVRDQAGLSSQKIDDDGAEQIKKEFAVLQRYSWLLKPFFKAMASRRILYAGQAYYNCYYLSRGLRENGWKADVLNWDIAPDFNYNYHGQDFQFTLETSKDIAFELRFYMAALYEYDVIHFSNAHGICFGFTVQGWFATYVEKYSEIRMLRQLGKIVSYANNGCLDGVLQSSFAKWRPVSVCDICIWKNQPNVCSDERNGEWGEFRNSVADYQCLLGGNRVDYNQAPTVHETPEFYCLDENIWDPTLPVPEKYDLGDSEPNLVRLYHAVGHSESRTDALGVNIKCSHIYLPLIDKLRSNGATLELISPNNVPNKEVKFLQSQADIFLEMLTFGWFGANAREAMMLGKPVICYLRPEWLDSVRREIPEYIEELPIVVATPQTVEAVLIDLIENPEKRLEIGKRSREFAIKWHSTKNASKRFDTIYTQLMLGDPLLREMDA